MKGISPSSAQFGFPTAAVDLAKLISLHNSVMREGNQYGFGSKVDLSDTAAEVRAQDVDCSGYVRWLLYQASGGALAIPDGSWIQHEWVEEQNFKLSSVASANLKDGALRIAFLAPGALGKGAAGHVALILNDETMESHGGTGPDSRPWDSSKRWMALSTVYVLTAPKVAA